MSEQPQQEIMMEKKFPTLYGMSSKGEIKSWKIWVAQFALESAIMVEHGQLHGKKQLAVEKIREGKNIGRSNETTPFEQAVLEAESKWTKQHDKNYTEKIPQGEASIELKLLPMLAQKYKERNHKIVWPAYVQPKLNGVRCLVQKKNGKITFWSRKGKVYTNLALFMEQEFSSFMKDGDILDGEVYNHGDVTFQELMSLIKNVKKPNIERLKQVVKFHCYDRPSGVGGFRERYLGWRRDTHPVDLKYLTLVDTYLVKDEAAMLRKHETFTGENYEGTMVRSGGDEAYNFQYRDNQLQKYKDFLDDEFKIVGCKEGVGSAEGQACFRCVTKQGKEFDVRCKGENAVREEQWQNKASYMGKELTVRYQTLSDDGIPIFPVGLAVRDYE